MQKELLHRQQKWVFTIFLIREEHKFLFYPDKLKNIRKFKVLANYYSVYLKFFKVSILLDDCCTRENDVDQIVEDDL